MILNYIVGAYDDDSRKDTTGRVTWVGQKISI